MRYHRAVRTMGAALCVVLALAACSSRGERKAREVVKEYNQALVGMYAEEELAHVEPYVTPEQMEETARGLHLTIFQELLMTTEIKEFAVKGVSRDASGEYLVDTDETWVYSLQKRATGAVTKGPEEAHYRNRYHVIVSEGAYLINGIDIGTE